MAAPPGRKSAKFLADGKKPKADGARFALRIAQ
jgi:hypothetical protein